MKTTTEDLVPVYDRAKSFYRKAYVRTEEEDGRNIMTLVSYNTDVAQIIETDNELVLSILNPEVISDDGRYIDALTTTTARHINEFIQQNGFEWMTIGEMRKKAEGE